MDMLYQTLFFRRLACIVLFFACTTASFSQRNTQDFLEGLFRSQIKEHQIAGLTFSIYTADTLELTKSWGYSHVATSQKVNENTGFMLGSVSKLFIWVAVMQLVEQGELDINEPVNKYLSGFQLPQHYEPVTMRHLMTHTPGFEDHYHLFSKDYDNLPDLETYLQENLPQQIYSPGTTPAYSNYGSVLAAFTVEQISGIDFYDYVEQNILEPLEMHQTTFRQPASYAISEARSKGYVFSNGRFQSPFDEYVLPAPAGSAVSSASDMLKFMKALLPPPGDEPGEQDTSTDQGDNILQRETLRRMLSLLHTPHPESSGMGYGFLRLTYDDKEIFWHGGDTYLFHSAFVLIPQMQTGIFLSMNTGETNFNYRKAFLLILDYLNGNQKEPKSYNRVNGLNHYTGSYRSSRRTESSYLKIFTSLQTINISVTPEGLLVEDAGVRPELFKPSDKEDMFVSGHKKLIFERNERGRINQVIHSNIPARVFEKVSFRESLGFNITLLIAVLLLCLKNTISPIISFFRGSKRSKQNFRWWLLVSALFLFLFFILFWSTFSNIENLIFEKPQGLRFIMILPLISLLLFVISVVFWMQQGIWMRQPIASTLWHFLGFLVMVLFYFQMHYWNFFNFWV